MEEQKIRDIFSDEQFVKELLDLETPEEVKVVLADHDIDVTVDDIMQVKELFEKKQNGEISDEELENVSGGFLLELLIMGVTAAVLTGTAGGVYHCSRRFGW